MVEIREENVCPELCLTEFCKNLGLESFIYPFEFLEHEAGDWFLDHIFMPPVPLAEQEAKITGNFIHDIAKIHKVSNGGINYPPWELIGELKNGKKFYFYASCTTTSFTAAGKMQIYVADTYQTLYDYAISGKSIIHL